MPTLTELAGTDYPKRFNGKKIKPQAGKSLVSSIENESTLPKRPLFFEHLGKCGLIEGNWKIVRFHEKPWELYNLEEDPTELNNLAAKNHDKLNEMVAKYIRWAKENKVLPREEVEKKMIYQF